MSVITATPVPADPPKVPTRWVSVSDDPYGDSHCYQASYAVAKGSRRWRKHSTEYRLPGTDEAEALAARENVIAGLVTADAARDEESMLRLFGRFIEAHKNLRRVQAKQSWGKP